MLRRYVLCALPLLLLGAQEAPPPPLAQAVGDLDGDGHAERARVEPGGAVVVDGSDGRERLRVMLPDAARVTAAKIAFVGVEDRVVVYAHAPIGHGQADEAVIGPAGVLYVGRSGPVGDGERSERLRVDDAGIVRWQTTPGFSRCDGEDMLFPERWDFKSGRFRPVLTDAPAGKPLHATPSPPEGLGGAPLGLFRFVAASTDASGDRRADRLAAPHELEDGAPATVWHAGMGGAARGAWATARAQMSAARVRAVEIVGGKEAPAKVTLLLGPSSDQQFTIDTGPGAHWVTLPDPLPTSCVSLVVAEPGRGDNAIAEVGIYTDVDGPRGLDRLVDEVAELKPDADGAAHLLMQRGTEAARAVAAAVPTTHGEGRRRLLQVLATIGAPETAPALGKALETAEPEDRATLVDALAKMGAAGAAEAVRVFSDATQTSEARADAATVLGRLASRPEAVAALVGGAGTGEPPVRLATMQALALAYRTAPETIEAGLTAGGDDARLGDLARAIGMAARGGPARPQAADALLATWQRAAASRFELRLRLVRAMGDLGDARLLPAVTEASRDGDPIVRAAAATAAKHLAGGRPLLVHAAGDGDPGVRRAALTALGGAGEAVTLDENALLHDGWPMVRRAAADGLGAACVEAHVPASPALAHALSGEGKAMRGADPSDEVRRAALAALGRCPGVPLSTVTAVLTERRQPVSVRELAAALVARRGGPEAAKALASALDDALGDPAGDEQTAGLAEACTRGLARTGDTSDQVLTALGEAANEPMSASVRAAAMETIGLLCPAGSGEALHKGEKDPDRKVRRAAQTALARCRR